jgi:anti-sigma B factor antagonist
LRLPAVPSITHRLEGDVVIIEPGGREPLSDNDAGLQPLVRRLAEQGRRKFILNLKGVNYIDSTGLGAIARATITISQRDGELRLCNIARRVRDLMDAAKLTPVFQLYGTLDDGLKNF